jgi:uncharacterized flavoprotein (TIGR03862 family)
MKQIAIIGAGPAGLMAAEQLAGHGHGVTVYDRMPSPARKLLIAGRGGLNLTHGEPLDRFLDRYGPARPRLDAAIRAFPPDALRAWCEGLGQETFVGSSGRVFPRAFKASPLLRAWLSRLAALGVVLRTRQTWHGWDDQGRLRLGEETVAADATVLALGGASWPRLGSDGGWAPILAARGIAVAPLLPANCGFLSPWSPVFAERAQGQPLKRIALSFAGRTVRGEAMITATGIEGGAVYTLSSVLRDAIVASGEAIVHVDLRPDHDAADLAARLGRLRGGQSMSSHLRKALNLDPTAIGFMREGLGATLPVAARDLAALVKAVPLRLTGIAPIGRAISTAGGIAFDEVDDHFMLTRLPGVFVAGEMLDWEAPTGGYLLQACFATAVAAAAGVDHYLRG